MLGPAPGETWRRLHQLSFICWFGLMSLHVLAHVWKAVQLGLGEVLGRTGSSMFRIAMLGGRATRSGLVIGSLVLGVALAIGALPLDHSWSVWMSRMDR